MNSFLRDGVEIFDGFRNDLRCQELMKEVHNYNKANDLPLIERPARGRSLRYRVIDGDQVYYSLPRVVALYDEVLKMVQVYDPKLIPLPNRTARLNVNVTPPQGEYRWHYDRNAVTAVLFLNEVQGGEIEMYPKFRFPMGTRKDGKLQHLCDTAVRCVRPLLRSSVVQPSAGRLILMQGDRCLHSVRRVEGLQERISIIMAYDIPRHTFLSDLDLNSYLYSRSPSRRNDHNYCA